MGVSWLKVIPYAVDVTWHNGKGVKAELPAIGVAHRHAGDLCNRIGLVCRLERPSQQRSFRDRLRGEFRIDAARTEKCQLLYAVPVCGVDNVRLDQQILPDKIAGIGI